MKKKKLKAGDYLELIGKLKLKIKKQKEDLLNLERKNSAISKESNSYRRDMFEIMKTADESRKLARAHSDLLDKIRAGFKVDISGEVLIRNS